MKRWLSIGRGDDRLRLRQRMEEHGPRGLGDSSGGAHPGADALAVRGGRMMSSVLKVMNDGSAHCTAHNQEDGDKKQTG